MGPYARSLLVAVMVGALACTGCGDDDPPGAGPSPTPQLATSATSGSPSPSESESTSAPSVTPASGPLLDLETYTINLPEGWQRQVPGGVSANGFDPGSTGGQVSVAEALAQGSTLDDEAKFALSYAKEQDLDPVRGPDREIAGLQAYVVSGHNDLFPTYVEFGMINADRVYRITITFEQDVPDAQDIIESVLASIALK